MAVQVSYPGVYIEEFAPGAPIQGVGTSTAAFIGPTAKGELDIPTKITSWDRFREVFGDQPLPGFFLWYAVRGFFENGGQVCYVVRASNGAYAEGELFNRAGNPIIRIRATQPGVQAAGTLQIRITQENLLSGASLYLPSGRYRITGRREISLLWPSDVDDPNVEDDLPVVRTTAIAQAAQFKPGDWVNAGAAGTRLQVIRVTNYRLIVDRDLIGEIQEDPFELGVTTTANEPTIRLANAQDDTRTIRIETGSNTPLQTGLLVPGTILTITQGTGNDLVSISRAVQTVRAEPLQTDPAITTYRVTFRQALGQPLNLDPEGNLDNSVQSEEFNLEILQGASSTLHENLSIDSAHPRFILNIVNASNGPVRLELIEPAPSAQPPNNLPAPPTADMPNATEVVVDIEGGATENLNTLGNQDYIDAIDTLSEIDDVNLIAIPDGNTPSVQQALIEHCELMGDRFAVLDALTPKPDQNLFGADSVEEQRLGLVSPRGYAALYYPWLRVLPVGPGSPILVPPSGHICGIIARSDNIRGVHKAPANEIVNGALGIERVISNIDQGLLNLQGINVIRVFQTGGRPILWGARTTASDLNWQYVNIRRLFLFIEESIQEGIRWAVFEPNNLQLWQKLKRTITEFLTRVWRDGALFGATAEEAFYVRIDEVLNPFSEQALGRLHIEIGLRPTYPAEFIIVRIGIWDGGSEVSEG